MNIDVVKEKTVVNHNGKLILKPMTTISDNKDGRYIVDNNGTWHKLKSPKRV